jgi:hypothetical protein
MTTHPIKTIAILVITLVCSTAQADLIGDSITLKLLYPDATTAFDTQNVLVVDGPADTQAMGTFDDLVDVNPEADTLFLTFKREADGVSPGQFVGFSATGINDTLTGVTVSTNIDEFMQFKWNFDGTRLVWDAHSVTVNWYGYNVLEGDYFNITLLTDRKAPGIPDGGTTFALLSLSFVALAGLKRKFARS